MKGGGNEAGSAASERMKIGQEALVRALLAKQSPVCVRCGREVSECFMRV